MASAGEQQTCQHYSPNKLIIGQMVLESIRYFTDFVVTKPIKTLTSCHKCNSVRRNDEKTYENWSTLNYGEKGMALHVLFMNNRAVTKNGCAFLFAGNILLDLSDI